jgi:predicted XRE-type DNA-binding protein
VTEGSSNVFVDLGPPNADQELMKARLTLQIYRIIKERGITQTEAGKILRIPQPLSLRWRAIVRATSR